MTPNPLDWVGLPADLSLGLVGGSPYKEPATGALSRDEFERLASFSHPDRRRSFVLGRIAARGLLADRLGVAPETVPLHVETSGALAVAARGVYVSLSHAGRGDGVLAAAAVGARPVGVDLEAAQPRHPKLLDRLLTPAEAGVDVRLQVGAADAASLVWTLKEAVLKGLGVGLRRGAHSVVLTDVQPGYARAEVGEPTAWAVRYERVGTFWLAVAWEEGGE